MSLIRLQPSRALQTAPGVTKADGGDKSARAPHDGNAADSVRLSEQGRIISKLAGPVPPSADNVRKLSDALANSLQHLFRNTAIDPRRAVGIEVDSRTGQVSVERDRPDARSIAALINGQPLVVRQIQDLATLSAHVVAAEHEATTSRAAHIAQRAAQIGSVITNYASRFSDNGENRDFSLTPLPRAEGTPGADRLISAYETISNSAGAAANVAITFDGTAIRVDVNGKPWLSTNA